MRLGGGRGVPSPFELLKEVSYRWFVGCVCVLCRSGNSDDGNEAVEEEDIFYFELKSGKGGRRFYAFFLFPISGGHCGAYIDTPPTVIVM